MAIQKTLIKPLNGNGSASVSETPASNPPGFLAKSAVALVPFTPVPFSGPDMVYAVGRVALYSAIAAYSWDRNRTIAYIAAGAAAMSVATSLTGGLWK